MSTWVYSRQISNLLTASIQTGVAFWLLGYGIIHTWRDIRAPVCGETGNAEEEEEIEMTKHLEGEQLGDSDGTQLLRGEEKVTKYEEAGFYKRLSFMWLNPLLKKGRKGVLSLSDVPHLAPKHRADRVFVQFQSSYDKQRGNHSAGKALLGTFWRQLLFTGLLALTKVCVMYVGPLLITPITNYVAGKEDFPYEGYALVGVLLVAKVTEVLAGHHYNFQSNKVGMLVRSSLITAVYRKGLKLSSHARQAHGAGQITNYMTVDVQMIADSLVQLHNVWTLPLQVSVALLILFWVVGISCFGGIAVMLVSIAINFWIVKGMRVFQRKSMKFKDHRMAATAEILNNMKIIKMQSWEDHFAAQVSQARNSERILLTKFMYCFSANIAVLWSAPVVVAVVTFGLCVILGNELTSNKVFTALATFRIMQEPLRLFPNALMNLSQAATSLGRLDKFFASEELEDDVEIVSNDSEYAVEIQNGSFRWNPEADTPTLKDINLRTQPGSLVAVVGMVGSGKSSLLSAILGEMPKITGKVSVGGTTAYVAQGAWIQNATIQDNILFGKPLYEARYQETLRSCALIDDLRQMEFGDQTEIGERGINLSGGQKQRIQLARAVYQDCDIYLLDDVFSAVDAHTGSELFEKCIKQTLKSKTVVLVTHQIEFLRGADMIVVMREGEIVQAGKYTELLLPGTEFHALVAAHEESMQKVESCENVGEQHNEPGSVDKSRTLSRRKSSVRDVPAPGVNKGTANLVEDEKKAIGHVSWRLYWLYATKILYGCPFTLLLIFQCCWQTASILSDYFLANATSVHNLGRFDPKGFILQYSLIGAVCALFITLRTFLLSFLGVKTAQAFFSTLLEKIMRAPMSFHDTTPTGRIMTRFSVDQSNVDTMICILIGACLANISQTLGVLIVVSQVNWQMVFIIVPLFFVFSSYQVYHLATSRELTRIDSVTKAPVIHHFSESIAGFQTIRAFREQDRFSRENVNKVNNNLRMDFHNNAANEWLGLRLEMIGTTILCLSALLMVMARNYVNADHVGLSLSYGLALNTCLYGLVYQSCQLENRMVAIERMDQYSRIQTEAALIVPQNRPSDNWPVNGSIDFQNLEMRYRTDTPLVLKGISFTIQGGEKVGVVGRTGSGKSSLIQALFRLVEPAGGRITVDGIDIRSIGLRDLRSKFGIIPQEPTLFKGTVRSNLDPLGEHSDAEIWEGLEKCQLAEIVRHKEERLDSEVVDNGENWSVGQRQLFCLGRALLKGCRILVLDEATASVDAQTDAILQRTIRREFSSCTVISIAHRIPSVMDSDKVLVLDKGYVKEFDSPSNLLDQVSSLFGALVREYATRSGSVEDEAE